MCGIPSMVTNCVSNTYDWVSNNKVKLLAVTVVAIAAIGYLTGQYEFLKDYPMLVKGARAATILCPLAYTAAAPLVLFAFGMGSGAPMDRYGRDQHMEMVKNYISSIGKVWMAWYAFVQATPAGNALITG